MHETQAPPARNEALGVNLDGIRLPVQLGYPAHWDRWTQTTIDAAAPTVIAGKSILAATIADIAAEAGRSAVSFYSGILLQLLRLPKADDNPSEGPTLSRLKPTNGRFR